MHGQGKIICPDGRKIEGWFSNDTFFGTEDITCVQQPIKAVSIILGGKEEKVSVPIAKKVKKVVQTKKNSREIVFGDGSKYVGNVLSGKAHGYGKHTKSDGTEYVG